MVFICYSQEWEKVITADDNENSSSDIAISARDSHVAVFYNNSIYVYGGSSGSPLNDFYELRLNTDIKSESRTISGKWRRVVENPSVYQDKCFYDLNESGEGGTSLEMVNNGSWSNRRSGREIYVILCYT